MDPLLHRQLSQSAGSIHAGLEAPPSRTFLPVLMPKRPRDSHSCRVPPSKAVQAPESAVALRLLEMEAELCYQCLWSCTLRQQARREDYAIRILFC